MTNLPSVPPLQPKPSPALWENTVVQNTHYCVGGGALALRVHGRLLSSKPKLMIYLLSKTHSLSRDVSCQPVV